MGNRINELGQAKSKFCQGKREFIIQRRENNKNL